MVAQDIFGNYLDQCEKLFLQEKFETWESVSAASIKNLCQSLCQDEKSTLFPLECLSFANTIQADLPTCGSMALVVLK